MATKKKQNTTAKREVRLRKAKRWLTTYNGTPKKIASHYRKRSHVDILTALQDLQTIGVEFTQEYLDAVKKGEEARIHQLHLQKEAKQLYDLYFYADSDSDLAFIAGYTSGGAPYGVTWDDYEGGVYDRIENQKIGKVGSSKICINCGRKMKTQFRGLKHCKCGISWKKDVGYFERSADMIFALERRNSCKKVKQVRLSVIRLKSKSYVQVQEINSLYFFNIKI